MKIIERAELWRECKRIGLNLALAIALFMDICAQSVHGLLYGTLL